MGPQSPSPHSPAVLDAVTQNEPTRLHLVLPVRPGEALSGGETDSRARHTGRGALWPWLPRRGDDGIRPAGAARRRSAADIGGLQRQDRGTVDRLCGRHERRSADLGRPHCPGQSGSPVELAGDWIFAERCADTRRRLSGHSTIRRIRFDTSGTPSPVTGFQPGRHSKPGR